MQDPAAQPGKTNMQVKQRAPRMHCDSAQPAHHQNKYVDYIIKTRSLNAKNHYMIIVIIQCADSTVHPARGDIPSWVAMFGSCYVRLIVLNNVVLYVIIHLIRTVYCLPTSDG